MVYATNYHGLCRQILNRFGYLIDPVLSRIDILRGVGVNIYDDEEYTKKRIQRQSKFMENRII